jgi:hypothetical protein
MIKKCKKILLLKEGYKPNWNHNHSNWSKENKQTTANGVS